MTLAVWEAGKLYPTGSVVQPLSASPAIATDIPNAGFESGDVGWDKGAGWAINQTRHFAGTWGAEFSGAGPANLDSTTPIAVNPGQSITCTLAVDQGAAASGDAGARVALVWYDAAMVLLSVSEGSLVDSGSDGTWKTSTVTAVAPINAAFVVPRAIAFSDGSESVWVDSFAWNYVSPPTTAGLIFKAVQPATGSSGATEPVWPTVNGAQVIDNEVIWEAMLGTRVVWEAHPILQSGTVEPAWPLLPDAIVSDEGIRWRAFPRVITDPKCPHSPVVLIMEGHVLSPDDDVVRFSAALAPRDWTTPSDAGFLNTGLSTIASVKGTALGAYRKNLTAWTASGFQLYQMDPDPELMVGLDAMEGIGTIYPKTLVPIVDDMLFLNSMGVRSINVAIGGNNLASGDVGAPVDVLVRRSIEIAEANGVEPFAAYYPGLGQYMLAFEGQPVDAVVVSGNLGDGFIGEAVTGFAYTSTGGVGAKTYAIGTGALDPGLTLNPDGTVTGTRTGPAAAYAWTVIATDSEGLESTPHADSAETTVAPTFILSVLNDGADDGVGVFQVGETGLTFVSFAKSPDFGLLYSVIPTTDGRFCVACGSSGLYVFSITAAGAIAYVGAPPVQPGVATFYGAFAPDDTLFVASFLASSGGHYAKAYTFDTTTGAIALTTLLSPAVAAAARLAAWSPDGTYCCIPINSSAYEFKIYKRTGTALVAVADPLPGAVTRRTGSCARFTNDGGKLLVFHENVTNPRVHVFVNNFDDTFTYDGDEFDVFPTSYVRQAAFDSTGGQLALAHDTAPYGSTYDYVDGLVGADFLFWENLPIASGTQQMFSMTFAHDDLLIGGRSGDSLEVWTRTGFDWTQQAEVADPPGYFIQLNYALHLCPRPY
jgi:hypothetical protein